MSNFLVFMSLVLAVTSAYTAHVRKVKVTAGEVLPETAELWAKIQSLEKQLTGTVQKDRIRRQSQNNGNGVAFFARLNKFLLSNLAVNQQIVLDEVVTNVGNAYNKQRGTFIAPVDGLYTFSASVMSAMDMEVHVAISHNGNDVAYVNARGTGGRHDQGSQTVVLSLQNGDEVMLKVKDYGNESLWGDKYTTFSGHLIHANAQ